MSSIWRQRGPLLSDYGQASAMPSPVNRMMAAVADDFRPSVDVNLGVGYVNEATIPRQLIVDATREVLADGERYPLALNYGGPRGTSSLIRSLRTYLTASAAGYADGTLASRQFIIGPNGATSLLEALATVLGPGLILTGDPIYYIYTNYLRRAGFRVLALPDDEFGLPPERIRRRLRALDGSELDALRFIYVMAVDNLTSTVLPPERMLQLLQLATEIGQARGTPLPLIVDRAYVDLVHDPAAQVPASVAGVDVAGVLYEVGTLSKIIAPGLRIGYLIGPGGPLLDALVQRTSDLGFSAPPINQEIASWILDHHINSQLARVRRGYQRKAVQVRRWLDEHLGDQLVEVRGGSASFYYYLTLATVSTSEDSAFFRQLTGQSAAASPRVLYLPGGGTLRGSGRGAARRWSQAAAHFVWLRGVGPDRVCHRADGRRSQSLGAGAVHAAADSWRHAQPPHTAARPQTAPVSGRRRVRCWCVRLWSGATQAGSCGGWRPARSAALPHLILAPLLESGWVALWCRG